MKLKPIVFGAIACLSLLAALPASAQFASLILGPLLESWIESEVEDVDNLSVRVSGSDNEIFSGSIDRVEVSGDNLIYNGFHITRVELEGEDIQLNAQEALNGDSLRLTEPLPVAAVMRWSEADLNRSLQAPLIQSQLAQAEVDLPLGLGSALSFQLRQPEVSLQQNRLQIDALVDTADTTDIPISLATGLRIQSTNAVTLLDPVWLSEGTETPIAGLSGLTLDLGPDVSVDQLRLRAGELIYRGTTIVQP